ncbi:glycoside hydrolase superfamily [Panaeolus papilionaceus]|nr:glycoside hydrolase superfamily [Panaeolus papilionaceus]
MLTEQQKKDIGKHFVFGFHGFTPSDNVKDLITKYHLQNIILFKRNIENAQQTRELINNLQKLSRDARHGKGLLVGIDQENGLVSAFSSPTAGTQFPGAMAQAATGSTELAKRVGVATGEELKAVGINWVYSPVADINLDSRNPVIGVRSFGEDPGKVAAFAVAASEGLVSAGVASTAKHFPGHGDTHVDSHLALPRIVKPKSQIESQELVPFKALIDSGIPSIMTGHMALPLLTDDDTPCSLSYEITTKLLRDELRYEGVVVTDCLEMDAIADESQGGCGVAEGALQALKAGADIVMICHRMDRQTAALERVYKALEAGEISWDLIHESGKRIDEMKKVFVGENRGGDWLDDEWKRMKEGHGSLSEEAYRLSRRVVWGNEKLPLNLGERELVLFTPQMETINPAVDSEEGVLKNADGSVRNTAGPYYLALAKSLEEKLMGRLKHTVYSNQQELSLEANAGGMIFVLRNADTKPWQIECLKQVATQAQNKKIPVVLVSSCGPYDLVGLEETFIGWTTYIQTFEFTIPGLYGIVSLI